MQSCLEHYQSREEFASLDLPAGMTEAEAWDLVSFARRSTSYDHIVGRTSAGRLTPAYFRLTKMAQETLVGIHADSIAGSAWSVDSGRFHSSPILRSLVISDLTAALERDGVAMPLDDVRLVIEGREPQTEPGLILANAMNALSGDPAALFDEIEGERGLSLLIERGVSPKAHEGLRPSPNLGNALNGSSTENPLDMLLKGFLGTGPCVAFPAVNILISSENVWELRPFLRWNGMHEAMLRHAGLMQSGLPLLSLVPLSRMRLEWERGLIGAAQGAKYPYGKAMFRTPYGIDSTLCFQQEFLFMATGLDSARKAVTACRERENELVEKFQADARLNERQQLELGRLVGGAAYTDAAAYMETYGIVSSTAHLDLAKLEEYGYLVGTQDGRKRMFTLPRHLRI